MMLVLTPHTFYFSHNDSSDFFLHLHISDVKILIFFLIFVFFLRFFLLSVGEVLLSV